MQIAAYICFGIAICCMAPFVLWFIAAVFIALGESLYKFIKTREPDSLFEFLCALFLISLVAGGILHHLANK